jgi:hypothetical protein
MPLTADAAFRGGGGGGGHFGGFRGGGGGGHFGGFRGGHIGGMRFGHGPRIGNFHSGRHAFRAPHTATSHTVTNHAVTNHTVTNHAVTNHVTAHHGLATRVSHGFSPRAFHNAAFLHGFHRFGVFGWVGPLFWPYAFGDIYCSVFWGYWGYGCADPYWNAAYGDPFWGYGYSDVYGGVFSPFAFSDLAPYLPNGPSSVRHARSRSGTAPVNAIAQMCGDETREVAGWPIDRIQQLIAPDDQQRAALDDLAAASVKAAQIIKAGCPSGVAFTPTGRLAVMEQRIEAMQQAVGAVRGPLEAFYGSLSEDQKAKFNAAASQPAPAAPADGGQRAVHGCTATAAASAAWPEEQIEAVLHPNEAQQTKLRALQSAAAQAAERLAASCPADMPATPTARLAAVSNRLDAMLTAVRTVRHALNDLYGDLSDEQKAQFNQIGQSRTSARQG